MIVVQNFYDTLDGESDRGFILMAAAHLEETLKDLHKAHIELRGRHDVLNKLSGPYGPLSSFSGCIQVAYAYGLIDKFHYEDLETVRRIRNTAAHSSAGFSFTGEQTRSRILAMKTLERASLKYRPFKAMFSQQAAELFRKFVTSSEEIRVVLKGHLTALNWIIRRAVLALHEKSIKNHKQRLSRREAKRKALEKSLQYRRRKIARHMQKITELERRL